MRVKWAYKNNILMVLAVYLKKYSSFDYTTISNENRHPLFCLMEMGKKDFTVIDEIFGKKDRNRSLQNQYPIRVNIKDLIQLIEKGYKISSFEKMYIRFQENI